MFRLRGPTSLDPITLATLGNELIKRLRSTGGRPALEGASELCKVPLSSEDVAALEKIVAAIEKITDTRPSLGQVASVILRMHLARLVNNTDELVESAPQEPAGCFFQKSVSAFDTNMPA